MVGGDVVVAGVDHTTISGFAQDYYLLDKSQCIVQQDTGQVSGSCPDSNIQVYIKTALPNLKISEILVYSFFFIITYNVLNKVYFLQGISII